MIASNPREPLLLLHGLGTTHADFSQVHGRLAEDFDVIAVDLPGQGDGQPVDGRPTIAALADVLERDMDARGLDRVHILGNSLGGRLALELARRHRALSVVAIAPSGLSILPERLLQLAGMALTATVVRALRPSGNASHVRHLPRALLAGLRAQPWKASPLETDALADGFGSPHVWGLLVWAIGMDLPLRLEDIDCPVLLAQGAADLIAAGQTARFLACVRAARFALVPFAGHAAQADAPEVVAALVRTTAARAA